MEETVFALPPDAMAERWTGRRLKEDEIRSRSGVERILPAERFPAVFHAAVRHLEGAQPEIRQGKHLLPKGAVAHGKHASRVLPGQPHHQKGKNHAGESIAKAPQHIPRHILLFNPAAPINQQL